MLLASRIPATGAEICRRIVKMVHTIVEIGRMVEIGRIMKMVHINVEIGRIVQMVHTVDSRLSVSMLGVPVKYRWLYGDFEPILNPDLGNRKKPLEHASDRDDELGGMQSNDVIP